MEFDFQDIVQFADFWSSMAQNGFGGLEVSICCSTGWYSFFEEECARWGSAHGKENGQTRLLVFRIVEFNETGFWSGGVDDGNGQC